MYQKFIVHYVRNQNYIQRSVCLSFFFSYISYRRYKQHKMYRNFASNKIPAKNLRKQRMRKIIFEPHLVTSFTSNSTMLHKHVWICMVIYSTMYINVHHCTKYATDVCAWEIFFLDITIKYIIYSSKSPTTILRMICFWANV